MSSKPLFYTRIYTRKGSPLLVVVGLVFLGATGCGNGPTEPEFDPSFMVGDWLADSLVMTSVANPEVTPDLVELGAVFTLLVQPSGRYTAILEGFGQSSVVSGNLTVDGAYVVLMPTGQPEERGLWERMGESVILVSDSQFDFNLDGTTEPATLRQVLSPKPASDGT